MKKKMPHAKEPGNVVKAQTVKDYFSHSWRSWWKSSLLGEFPLYFQEKQGIFAALRGGTDVWHSV